MFQIKIKKHLYPEITFHIFLINEEIEIIKIYRENL